VVVDKSMAYLKTTVSGLAKDGCFICNFDGAPGDLRTRLELDPTVRVFAVDASGISLKSLGKEIPNTPILGGLVRATEVVALDSVGKVLGERFKGTLQTANAEALRLGYEGVKSG